MIDFLNKCGIKETTIKELKNKYNEELLYCLDANEYQIKDIITYFNSININCIDDILINYPGLFLKTLYEIKTMFTNKNIDLLVKMINDDYTIIEKLI